MEGSRVANGAVGTEPTGGTGGRPTRAGVAVVVAMAWVGMTGAPHSALGDEPPAVFRAGAAVGNVSPWHGLSMNGGMTDRKVGHVHDELHARALVLDDGSTRLAFVVVDICMIPREVVADAKAGIERRVGLRPDHVLISATHAHSCPTAGPVFQSEPDPDYRRFLAVRIADAVSQSVRNLAPARVGWGVGRNEEQVFNRRWWMKPGTVPPDPFGRTTDRVKMNPAPGSPDLVRPAGPTDPEVPVLAAWTTKWRPIAVLANYSLHYVGGTGADHASADYFGEFAARLESLLTPDRVDPPVVAIMSNGTSGDINNINVRTPQPPAPPYGQIRRVAAQLSDEVSRVARAITYLDRVTLDARAVELKLGVRKPGPDDLSRAAAILEKARGKALTTPEETYARETMLLKDYPDEVPVTVQALRVGDLGIVAIPCEVFAEIGLEIKARSPLKPTFVIELANGYNGYLPTKEQHALGGYETWRARSSYLETDAASKIVAAALGLLDAVRSGAPAR